MAEDTRAPDETGQANEQQPSPADELSDLIEKFRELRKGTSLGALKIRDLIDEGRRY